MAPLRKPKKARVAVAERVEWDEPGEWGRGWWRPDPVSPVILKTVGSRGKMSSKGAN